MYATVSLLQPAVIHFPKGSIFGDYMKKTFLASTRHFVLPKIEYRSAVKPAGDGTAAVMKIFLSHRRFRR